MAAQDEAVDKSSSLNALDTTAGLFIRAVGRNERDACYIVSNFSYNTMFSVSILEHKSETTVRNMKGELMLSGFGGLNDIDGKMNVYSRLNDFNLRIAIIERHELCDTTERDPLLQLWMEEVATSRRLVNIVQKKDLIQPGNKLPGKVANLINCMSQSSTVVVHYDSALSALKKGIIMLTGIKLYYCLYNFHKHPMPMGIPSRMPPGKASPPSLNILETWSEVKLRYSCRTENDTYFIELLDGQTLALLLIAECTLNRNYRALHIQFKDMFGVLQFRLRQVGSKKCIVYNTANTFIGTILGDSYNDPTHKCCAVKQEVSLEIPRQNYHNTIFRIYFLPSTTHDAEFVMNFLMNMMEFRMRHDLTVDKKVMIVVDAAACAVMYYEMLCEGFYPLLTDYPFRRQT